MRCLESNSRVNDLLDSRRASDLVGPTHGIPSSCKASTMPSASGSSGPTITKSGLWSRAWRRMFSLACLPFHSVNRSGGPSTRGLSRKHLSMALVRPSFPMSAGFRLRVFFTATTNLAFFHWQVSQTLLLCWREVVSKHAYFYVLAAKTSFRRGVHGPGGV